MSGGEAVQGEKNGRARLTEQDVMWIRDVWEERNMTMTAMAAKYGVSEATVRKAIHGKTWKHL